MLKEFMNLQKRLEQKSVIILDGALGTELQRRGVKTKLPLWSAEALLENPKLVQEIHEDYIGAGAEIITANTFRTNVRTIKKAGIKEGAKAVEDYKAGNEKALNFVVGIVMKKTKGKATPKEVNEILKKLVR